MGLAQHHDAGVQGFECHFGNGPVGLRVQFKQRGFQGVRQAVLLDGVQNSRGRGGGGDVVVNRAAVRVKLPPVLGHPAFGVKLLPIDLQQGPVVVSNPVDVAVDDQEAEHPQQGGGNMAFHVQSLRLKGSNTFCQRNAFVGGHHVQRLFKQGPG